jgi:hypothetical protein
MLPRFSTEEGMKIDERCPCQKNALASIEQSLEPDSNVTIERDRDCEKALEPSLVA